MRQDAVIMAALSALALIAIVVTDLVSGDIPSVLAASCTTLIGATAGLSVGSRTNRTTPDDSPE